VEYDGKLEVVGVAIGRFGRDEVAKFVNKTGLTFPIVMIDPQYETAKAFGGVPSIPTTFLIDADGIVREVWQGYHAKQVYESAFLKVLGT